MAGTTWPNLVAGTPARAADVEAKFDWIEGNINPMSAGVGADNTYDLGTTLLRWRAIYNVRNFLGDGSAALPSLTFQGDAGNDTGLFLKGANAIGLSTAGTERGQLDASGNFVWGTAAIATSATDGFIYLPGCAGTPSGTPTTYAGRSPVVVDTSNNQAYFYANGAWRSMAGSFGIQNKGITSTTNSVTTAVLSVSGPGMLHQFAWDLNAVGGTSGMALILDGVTLISNNTTTSVGQQKEFFRDSPYTTTILGMTTTGLGPTLSTIDLPFKSSMTVYLVSSAVAGRTTTARVLYSA